MAVKIKPSITPPVRTSGEMYIVGVGASAGGLDALQELFDNIPENSGFAFVVIQHLSPDYKSLMGEILSKHTAMKVLVAEEGVTVKPNAVYLLPSTKTMTIQKGRLVLEDKIKTRMPNMAIDLFFTSLAADQGNKAIGIILSGTGTDGTKGIQAIKSNGGVVIVQDPMTAEFDGMPNSAVSTGHADLILPPEMIADELMEYLKEAPFIKSFNALNEKEESIFEDILELVKENCDLDFRLYKKPTLNRRLAKRMGEKNIKSITDYYRFLKNHPDEVTALGKEFLINVTKFFRDTEAFDLLKPQVLQPILLSKKADDSLKIWVVACSTGEEAYSIAIGIRELLDLYKRHDHNIKIFATDIDQDALNVASRGQYTAESLKDVSAERLNKFFAKEGNTYTVIPDIRKMVVFAKHNITKDPPFSKIDFLTCRNMLIYMSTPLQKNVIQKFHFALNENGYLMLGPSESMGTLVDYFKEIDKKWKIFKCVIKSQQFNHDNYAAPIGRESFAMAGTLKSQNALNNISEIFKDTLLEEYKYAGIFIDKDMEVKQAIGNFKSFMSFPDEKLNFNLLKLVAPDLGIALGMAVRKAMKENERVVLKGVKVQEGKLHREINVIVKPYLVQQKYLQPFLFVILEEAHVAEVQVKKSTVNKTVYTSERIIELEHEIRDMRENLQAVIEEVETANEELQASNEEIISANEELQSTNEELQSLNEELHTVNSEYQMKIKELIELNDDQNNYFKNTDIGQIFIDKRLIIRKFSPVTTRQINLIESDIGRSIADISTNFKSLDFINGIKEVMQDGKMAEKEVRMDNGKICLMRISPYIRQDKTRDGVVVSFIDITEMKWLNGVIQAVFNSSPNGIIALNAVRNKAGFVSDFEFVAINKKAPELFPEINEKLIGKCLVLESKTPLNGYVEEIKKVVGSSLPFHAEYFDAHEERWMDISVVKMMDAVLITIADITHKKKAANLLMDSFEQLKVTSDELTTTNKRLEQSNYDLVQFASVASHDLKEPLRKIQIFGNFLKEKIYDDLQTPEKNFLDKIIGSSNRMQALIEDVLTLSKLSNNEIEKVPVDLNETIRQIIDDIDITIREKNATIEYDALPVTNAKPGQMRQLFQNLISNSLKFIGDTAPVIKIKTTGQVRKNKDDGMNGDTEYFCIEVSDNGIGFDDKYNEKVFGLFQRLHGNGYEGTGLGLAICKKIVENHNGHITVSSRPGEGATFRVLLPG